LQRELPSIRGVERREEIGRVGMGGKEGTRKKEFKNEGVVVIRA